MDSESNEEKKLEDVETLSSNSKSKIDSILFVDDSGPASELLKESEKEDSSTEDTGGLDRSFSSEEEQSASDQAFERSQSEGALNDTKRTVTFGFIGTSAREIVQMAHLAPGDATKAVEMLHEKLTQTQIDLSGEKALRKRKEKNLIKLAKELNNRAIEMEEKNQKIAKLEVLLVSVETKLVVAEEKAERLHREVEEMRSKSEDIESMYKAEKEQFEARLEAATGKIKELEEEKRSLLAATEASAAEMRKNHEEIVSEIQDRLEEAICQVELLKKENQQSDLSTNSYHEEIIDSLQSQLHEKNDELEKLRAEHKLALEGNKAKLVDAELARDEVIHSLEGRLRELTEEVARISSEKDVIIADLEKKHEQTSKYMMEQIEDATKTITEMNEYASRSIPSVDYSSLEELEAKYKEETMRLEERLQLASDEVVRLRSHVEQDKADYETAQNEAIVILKQQLQASADVADNLRAKLSSIEHDLTMNGENASPSVSYPISLPWLLMVIASVFIGTMVKTELFSMDALCAPVKPGTNLADYASGSTFDAPWWAPLELKSKGFGICNERPKTRLIWEGDRISIYDISGGNETKLWEKRAVSGAKVDAHSLTVIDKKKKNKEYFVAPWAT